jgi:hypothetical protein
MLLLEKFSPQVKIPALGIRFFIVLTLIHRRGNSDGQGWTCDCTIGFMRWGS